MSRLAVRAALVVAATLSAACPKLNEPEVREVSEMGECSAAPAWSKIEPCRTEEHIYAAGSSAIGGSESAFAMRGASSDARAAIPGIGGIPASVVTEIPNTYFCTGKVFALIRIKATLPELPECEAPLKQVVARPGCPDWTAGIAWMEGTVAVGVGMEAGEGREVAEAAVGLAKAAARDLEYGKDEIGDFAEPQVEFCDGITFARIQGTLR